MFSIWTGDPVKEQVFIDYITQLFIGTRIVYIAVYGRLRGEITNLIQLIVSVILYFVIFFGIAFILNMLLRRTWLMTGVYPFITILIISKSKLVEYFTMPKEAFATTYATILSLGIMDIIILLSGLIGTIVSGIVIQFLRRSGYQMF